MAEPVRVLLVYAVGSVYSRWMAGGVEGHAGKLITLRCPAGGTERPDRQAGIKARPAIHNRGSVAAHSGCDPARLGAIPRPGTRLCGV